MLRPDFLRASAWLGVVLSGLLFLAACQGSSQQTGDPITVADLPGLAPDRVDRLLANEYVEVLSVALSPGAQLPVFDARPCVLFPLNEVDVNLTLDQHPTTWEAPRGTATWQAGGRMEIRNASTREARFLMLYRVTQGLPAVVDRVAGDVADTLPEHTEVLLDNDYVRVLDVTLPARTATPLHAGLNRVVYALNAFQLRHGSLDASGTLQTESLPVEPGYVRWENKGPHLTENIGDSEAHFVVFGFRQ